MEEERVMEDDRGQAEDLVLAFSKIMRGDEPADKDIGKLEKIEHRSMAITALKSELDKLEPSTVRYKWFGVADPSRLSSIRILRRGLQGLYADAVLQHANDNVKDPEVLSWIRHNVKNELRKVSPKFW
jgi:hypothetical protein